MSAAGRGVAVVITTYNHAHFLPAAIDSVLAQTVAPVEILVVDDGSRDRPEDVVARYPGVRLFRQPNRGLAAARNGGTRETTAPLILFLDADDQLTPTAIETGLESFDADPAAAFTYGAYRIVEVVEGHEQMVPFVTVPREAFAAFLRENAIGMHGTVLYRRGPLEHSGGFAEHLRACEDYDMYLRLSMDHPVLCHPDHCADYYFHQSNMSRDPGFMLSAALGVLGAYRGEAERRGLRADYEAGVAEWKAHYVDIWIGSVPRRPLVALRSGATLARLAPGRMVRRIAGLRRRLLRRRR